MKKEIKLFPVWFALGNLPESLKSCYISTVYQLSQSTWSKVRTKGKRGEVS